MDIRSILVNVDLNTSEPASLRYAIDLAKTFNALLIGIAAEQPNPTYAGIDGGAAAAEFYADERTAIETQLKRAEDQFGSTVPADVKSEWLAYVANPTRSVIGAARTADLIVTSVTTTSTLQAPRQIDLGELVLAAGRPVVAVAAGATSAPLDKVVIGWKDTREARRAVADAVPFLARAKDVVAYTVSEGDPRAEQDSLNDLLVWLQRHEIKARGEVLGNKEGFVDVLESKARAYGADLLVAGGYGHSRMREWLFGGMTRNLIQASTLNRFFSN